MKTPIAIPARTQSIILCAALYIAIGALSLSTNYTQTNTATVWIPTGFSIGLLVARGVWLWPAVALASFVLNASINVLSGTIPVADGIVVAFFIALGNTGEALTGWYLSERFAGGAHLLARSRNVFAFAFTVAIVPPLVSMACGVAASRLGGLVATHDLLDVLSTWYSANALGILIFVAPTIALCTSGPTGLIPTNRPIEIVLLILVLVFVSQTVSGIYLSPSLREVPRSYMIIPLLLWASFRFGTAGSILSILIVTLISVVGTMRGFEAFPANSRSLALTFLQLFLGFLSVMTLSISAGLNEVNELRTNLENQVRARTRDVERLLRSRELFTTLVAHDLQSPLYGIRNALRAAVNAIKSNQMSLPDLASAMTLMDQTCSDLATRIAALLETDLIPPDPRPKEALSLCMLVAKVAETHRLSIKQNTSEVVWRGDRTLAVRWPAEVEHILDTLISNALKFSPRGSPIEVEGFEHDGKIEVHVVDRGGGVKAEDLPLLFRFDMRTSRRAQESNGGLGLYLASEQADDLGGRLSYAFTPPNTSTFRLVLPI